ncbi:hypothetical protein RV18_GL003255 [Enterococcus termitis]|nr:hypothetical protein RV18_GL003255 [Enterococcus termitis]
MFIGVGWIIQTVFLVQEYLDYPMLDFTNRFIRYVVGLVGLFIGFLVVDKLKRHMTYLVLFLISGVLVSLFSWLGFILCFLCVLELIDNRSNIEHKSNK